MRFSPVEEDGDLLIMDDRGFSVVFVDNDRGAVTSFKRSRTPFSIQDEPVPMVGRARASIRCVWEICLQTTADGATLVTYDNQIGIFAVAERSVERQ